MKGVKMLSAGKRGELVPDEGSSEKGGHRDADA